MGRLRSCEAGEDISLRGGSALDEGKVGVGREGCGRWVADEGGDCVASREGFLDSQRAVPTSSTDDEDVHVEVGIVVV